MKHEGSSNPFSENFNWFLFLEKHPKDINLKEMEQAERLASSWVTCACGQLCKALPKKYGGKIQEPEDSELSDLGMEFHQKITWAKDYRENGFTAESADRLDKAKEILIKIEQRTTELLQNL
jgi:hypothetical protein